MRRENPDLLFPSAVGLITMILLVTRFADDMSIIGQLLGLGSGLAVLIPAFLISASVFRLIYNEWGVEDLVALLVIGASMVIVGNGGEITPIFDHVGGAILTFSVIGIISLLLFGRIGGGGGRYG